MQGRQGGVLRDVPVPPLSFHTPYVLVRFRVYEIVFYKNIFSEDSQGNSARKKEFRGDRQEILCPAESDGLGTDILQNLNLHPVGIGNIEKPDKWIGLMRS